MTNRIHPSAIISGDVRLGTGNTVGPFAHLRGPLTLGDDNWIGTGVVLGAPPEVRGADHPADADAPAGRGVSIGSRNVLREYCQVHQGWETGTVIGDDAFIMNQSYLAHDVHLEDGVTLASSVLLAGHVRIGEGTNLGLGTSVHQRRRIGARAMVGMGSVVTRDLPPFALCHGSPARVRGANVVGLQRAGLEPPAIEALAAWLDGGPLPDAGVPPAVRAILRGWTA